MLLFILNFFLAIAWTTLTGEFNPINFAFGYLLGLALLLLGRGSFPPDYYSYFRLIGKVPKVIGFIFYFLYELTRASVRVLIETLTPRLRMVPGVIGIPLDAQTDLEITLLANFITLTPGTLSLDVSPDRRILYIHAMYIDDEDVQRVKDQIKNGFERRLLEVLR